MTISAAILRSVLCIGIAATVAPAAAEVTEARTGGFEIRQSHTFADTPHGVYDALTGDISGWWDHSFAAKPSAFFVDARPGGGFYEYFDAGREDGVLHGTVIYAKRGEKLTFRGPLGLSGNALDLVVTYTLAPLDGEEGQTQLDLFVSGAGRLEEDWAASVDAVWTHFLRGRLKPYIEAGCHRRTGCRHEPRWGK